MSRPVGRRRIKSNQATVNFKTGHSRRKRASKTLELDNEILADQDGAETDV